jgi:p-aminobenzoyl-glutamate transporter AbgT
MLRGLGPLPVAFVVAAVFGVVSFGAARAFGLGEADVLLAGLRRRLRRAKNPSAEGS